MKNKYSGLSTEEQIKRYKKENKTLLVCAINSERDFRKTQQKISNNIENSLQMIA